MLKIVMALALVMPQVAVAGQNQSHWPGAVEMAQSGGINSRTGRPYQRESQPDRRTRYYCQLDNGGGCPQTAGRAGERCRCSNQTGGGRLVAY